MLFSVPALAQPACPDTPIYSTCDLVFELNAKEAADHPNPYATVKMHGEFRSPEAKTYLMNAFWDGGQRMVIRITPVIAGEWVYRITSNVARFDGLTGRFNAVASDSKGFVRVNNYRHFSYTEKDVWPIPHLWMGDTSYRFAVIDRALFEQMVDTRAEQKFNHIRGFVFGNMPGVDQAFSDPMTPNPAYFRELDSRVRYMNERGITADLILGGDRNHLADFFPTWRERQRYIQYVVSRYAPMNVTWQAVQEYEEYQDARRVLRQIGTLIQKLDPYQHPRSTHTLNSSSPLLPDRWMNYITYQTSDLAISSIEHQQYMMPQVNTEFGYENSGAGASHAHHVDTDTFRHRLWNLTMDGMYPTYGNTGTYGGRKFKVSAKYLDAPGAQQMTHWYDFFSKTRHWELEPYFDVDGGRAIALTGIEYIVYLEKPGPVEVVTEKHKYKVYWFNPISGEYVQVKKEKEFKGERFSGQPPDLTHDWVLHLSRDGKKEGMLRSWHFESRRVVAQEVELDPKRRPYDIVEPSASSLPVGKPVQFSLKLTRKARATRLMRYMWTAEVAGGGEGFRIVATGAKGDLRVPPSIVKRMPANVVLKVLGINLLGKVYSLDRVYNLTKE